MRTSFNQNVVLQMTIGAIIISFAPVFVKLSDLNPIVEGVYRTWFGAITLCLIAFISGQRLWYGWRAVAYASLGGLCFAGDLACWQWSVHYVGPGLATILGNFQVFFLALIGLVFFGERFHWRKALAFPLAFVGLLMLVGFHWGYLSETTRLGVVLGLATAVFYALLVVSLRQTRYLAEPIPAMVNLIYVSIIAGALMALMAIAQGHSLAFNTPANFALMLAYGALCQGVAWLLIARSLPALTVSLAGFIILFQPSLAFVWDVLFFHRVTTKQELLGALLTLVAIYLGSTAKSPAAKAISQQQISDKQSADYQEVGEQALNEKSLKTIN